MEYKFNTKCYLTKGVNISIQREVQEFLWHTLDHLIRTGVALDYLQVFQIQKTTTMVKITHTQEEPEPFEFEYNLLDVEGLKLEFDETKVYVIDNSDYSIMLLADEY